ncbi:MAG: LysR substrate-binding domain-containing protein [Rhodobacteraceae bacterium]|nr:LysR substrate-binding domain-containing protein [Paracoccaceae bacterium]
MTAHPAATLRDSFIAGMSFSANTVNIVTTNGTGGRGGVTVSAMSSVSADAPKPTLLVCVHQMSPVADKIIQNGVFCVNVLRDDQAYISDAFAGRFKDQVPDKFDCADWVAMPSGAPRIVDPLVGFDCTVVSSNLVGTHYVFFGEVGDIFMAQSGKPLIYANRAYGTASRIEGASTLAAGRASVGKTLTVGCQDTFGPYFMPELIDKMMAHDPSSKINLVEGDQRRVLECLQSGDIDLALLYDLDLPDTLEYTALTQLTAYVLLGKGHPLADKSELTPADLAPHPMILLDAPPSRNYFTAILEQAGVTPNIAHRSSNFEMVRGLVGRGLGYTLLTTNPAASVTYDGRDLIHRRLISDAAPSKVVLARRRGVKYSRPAEQFMWLCHDFFGLQK